ncbi:bacterial alpha-L-rhamnosidase-domain-containing protein [Aspergillus affinis]|uniref:bacterial alpha-L-rhamnosidase-domain-containing protein n=1 Tax=Aspergillus affinis TaxID=1070780 RepID=UPI0022FDB44E|nr:bacterial alpha-L-rhamnosidase-domain-containing protein [Aspergillus affinis]KAI9035583.1 bacterial alpha-L-rhamnosidase-domain-containing protein [Aspergillus affinis]
MKVTDCGIHGFQEVIGIDTDDIRFYWSLVSNDGNLRQVAYRVILWIAAGPVASATNSVCWDSGRVQSDAQRNVVYTPIASFQSTTFHYWQVTFVGYDATALWQAGENVIGAHVGNGFYAGDQGSRLFWPTYEDNTYVRYGNELYFFAEIHLHYPDGSHDTIITDPSWEVRKSATSLANIYASEDFDRRQYPGGWDSP